MLLILDIDETLLHTFSDKVGMNPELEHLPNFILGRKTFGDRQYFVNMRPHVKEFLKYAFENFEVAIWSAASFDYIEECIKLLGYKNEDFKFIYSYDECTNSYDYDLQCHVQYKKLEKIKKEYDLEQVLIVDNLKHNAKYNYGNLIHIYDFTVNPLDKELFKLTHYLEILKNEPNVRNIEKREWSKKMSDVLFPNVV